MSVAKSVEISAESETSFDDAIRKGVERACQKLDNVQSCWIKDQDVHIENGEIRTWRVWLKVTFQLK